MSFVDHDVTFVHSGLATKSVNPKTFYKGYFEGWGAIEAHLDVRRIVSEDISIEVILTDEKERTFQAGTICS